MNLIQSNVKTMSSREIAELTGKQLSHIHRDFKNMMISLGFHNGVLMPNPNMDQGFTYEMDDQNRISSINLNQELTLTLISGYSAKLRNSIIKRWQELESAAQTPEVALPDFSDPVAAARAWADAKESEQAALLQLEHDKPKVAFVENLVERNNLMTATQVGQKHKMSAIKLNNFLVELGGVYSKNVKRSKAFTQAFIDKGLGELKQTEQGYSQALFTPKGEIWINEQLISEGVV